MNVLHINDHLAWKGGVETYLINLIPRLEAEGVRSRVLFGTGETEVPVLARAESVPLIAQVGDDPAVVKEVTRRVQEFEADVIHLHGIQNLGVYRAALASTPVVMTAHDYRPICPASTFFYKRSKQVCQRTCGIGCFAVTARHHCLTPRPSYALPFYRRSRFVMKHANEFAGLVAPSASAAERYIAAGFPEDRVQVIPYFCPIEPAEHPRPVPGVPTLTYIGRIASNKGWDVFIDALALLPQEVRGRMIGFAREDQQAMIRDRARAAGCLGRLEVIPWATREQIEVHVQETSILVFPSIWPETLGIVGLEALARGVPVIGSDIGGVREWLEDGVNGIAVPPRSAKAIAEAAATILSDPQTMQQMGEAGLETIRNRFLPEHHLARLVEVYKSAHTTV